MNSALAALALAGFLLAHAMDHLSRPQTPDLMPVAFVARGQEQMFITFEGATVEEMLERGKEKLAAGKYDAWALAYEGFVVTRHGRTSAVFVHSWRRGLDSPVVIAQTWMRSDNGIDAEYLGPAVSLSESSAPASDQQTGVHYVDLDEKQIRVLTSGMEQYRDFGRKVPRTTHW